MGSNARLDTRVLTLQRAHGLTRAEARVATRLAEGMSVGEIASDLRVTVETIRSHLKRAFAKTGSRRQSELVRLVLVGRAQEGRLARLDRGIRG